MLEEEYMDRDEDFDDESGEEEIEPVEIPKEVRHLRTQSYDKSVRDLVSMIDDRDIDLDPDYQRNYLWDNKKASLLIESILLNIPIPVVYVAENEDSEWNVIDGLQRLTSLHRYFKNEFKLSRLEVLGELNGLTFHNLPPKAKRMLGNGMFRVVVLLAETHPEIKYDVFMRLNTGAVKLNEQELRNCLYRGDLNILLKELRNDQRFLKCLKLNKPHNRFVDAEIVLRFFSMYEGYDLQNQKMNYPGRMKTFLNEYMEKNKKLTNQKKDQLTAVFNKSLDNFYSVLGDRAFFRPDKGGQYETRINRSLIDVVMVCFAYLDSAECKANKNKYRDLVSELCDTQEFLDAITIGTSDSKKVEKRIEMGLKKFGVL